MPDHSTPKADAVCFTAGPKGAPFAAGVIHAFLAADRDAPTVVAGISSGALSASAMERAYRELNQAAPGTPEREVARWNWYRRYLEGITKSPLDALWNAIPDPHDFFADKPPVSDLSVRSLPPILETEERVARQNFYRLVRLGVWLAGLGVSVGDLAKTVVSWVRFKERYALWVWQGIRLFASGLIIATKVFTHLCFSPQFVFERRWRFKYFPRPLFGWQTWLLSVFLTGSTATAVGELVGPALPMIKELLGNNVPWLSTVFSWFGISPLILRVLVPVLTLLVKARNILITAGAISFAASVFIVLLMMSRTSGVSTYLLNQVGIARGLLHQYHLHRKLFEVFRHGPLDQADPLVASPNNGGAMHLIIVAAPLQRIPGVRGQQVWAAPGSKLVNALLATLAAPGLFPPVTLEGDQLKDWEIDNPPARVDLIDGAVVRQNPLPALFAWLRKDANLEVAKQLSSASIEDPRIHIVYNVPTKAYSPKPASSATGAGTGAAPAAAPAADKPPESIDIITAAFNSMELARRRDTKLECRQTNFLSEMVARIDGVERALPLQAVGAGSHHHGKGGTTVAAHSSGASPSGTNSREFPIFADEIAPETDIDFSNNLAPTRGELLEVVAAGCRLTLGQLYRSKLAKIVEDRHISSVPCHELLQIIAHDRTIHPDSPGLSEVCAACTRRLVPAEAPENQITAIANHNEFSHLNGSKSRIVFVASGGVFRGAFHIGVIAAMQAARIKPDLIVGASVGSLMGGALAAISTLDGDEGHKLLGRLCRTFLHVDKEIALTRTLKNAAKQLGTRTRSVKLSPARLRRMIRKGGVADSAFAVTGAPPELIDAISTVFLFPHDITLKISAEFVAGHIADAMNLFWAALKKETLRRLEIENALMGTSLIEDAARKLLGEDVGIELDSTQPYHSRQISFFGTTSDLNRKQALLLPRDLENVHSYDFIKAALSSSAFPVVFSPRQESEVLPGTGRTNVLFSDGGMFDNLPFFPAIEILSSVQLQSRAGLQMTSREALEARQSHPDLFIAGALESEDNPTSEADNAIEIYRRAGNLNVNVKLNSFLDTSSMVDEQITRLLESSAGKHLPQGTPEFMDSIVPAAVLKIAPTDSEHLNGTFAFCRATGLDEETIQISVADGCFRTLDSLAQTRHSKAGSLEQRAVNHLIDQHRMERIRHNKISPDKMNCPFFVIEPANESVSSDAKSKRFACPFVVASNLCAEKEQADELRTIYKACTKDSAHVAHSKKIMQAELAAAQAAASEKKAAAAKAKEDVSPR